MGIGFAVIGALGVLMAAMSLFATQRPVAMTEPGERLRASLPSIFGEAEVQRARPLMDRLVEFLFGGAGAHLGQALNRREADEMRLRRADYPKPFVSVESFYVYKVAITIWMVVLGLVVGSVCALMLSTMAPLIVPLAVVLGTIGFCIPDLSVSRAASRRREQTIAEMASALGRLATFVAAGNKLDVAIRKISERPGGPFVRELRQVAVDYGMSSDLEGALDAMSERYPLQEIVSFTGRMKAAVRMGGSVAPTLRVMASDASEKLNLMLEERAGRNTLLMIAPIGMAVSASLAILIAPGAVVAIQMFTSAI